jgi:hypothetical protein
MFLYEADSFAKWNTNFKSTLTSGFLF